MASASTSLFKPLSMADSCLLSIPSIFIAKTPYPHLSVSPKPIKFHLSYSHSSLFPSPSSSLKTKAPSSIVTFVAQTSDWARQEEDNTVVIEEEVEEELTWENQEFEETTIEASQDSEESGEDGLVEEREEESYPEPPEEAKIFVGNLPYDIDSEKLAHLFEQAGVVEIAEVIYNRETDQSRGFGFVTMSTVEEAEKAVEMFSGYDLGGRLLTVNKAAPRGSRPERLPRVFDSAPRIYVGNLPWDVDNARLEQVFSEHGKVAEARVVYDRETGRSRGFGFVTMSTQTELEDAIAALDGQSLDGRALRVNIAEGRPRRSSF